MKAPIELGFALSQFTGSEQFHRWSVLFRNMFLTDGVKYLCDNAGESGCYWLADAIASYQPRLRKNKDTRLQDMQFWNLKVNPDRTAVLTCVPDKGEKAVVTQKFDSTDFQMTDFDLWVASNGQGLTILLPSEW